MSILLGAIADDFTGATDLANTLVQQGMRTIQIIGVPDKHIDPGETDAVVVALKSRSIAADLATSQSLASLAWLQAQGARQFFFKYCSTFDSTPEGNIGPVADALMDALGADLSVVCPAFPTNERTVYKGNLFVKDQPLAESPMKDHPLNPMRDSSLLRLMDAQSGKQSGLVPHGVVASGVEPVRTAFNLLQSEKISYAITDAITDADLLTVGTACADHKLVTGGSGIALGLPENFRRAGLLGEPTPPRLPEKPGRSVVLAGSCSQATRAQIAYAEKSWPSFKIDVHAVAAGSSVQQDILNWSSQQDEAKPLLIYASADPDEVNAIQEKYGVHEAGQMVEGVMGRIANELVKRDARRIVVAGGETSGAVVSSLGIRELRIGPEIAPGVPWTETPGEPGIALALKSGNFGAEDFFVKALEILP